MSHSFTLGIDVALLCFKEKRLAWSVPRDSRFCGNNLGALFSDKAIWQKEIMQHDQHDLQEVGSPKKPKDIETFHGLRPGNLEGTFVSCGFQNLDPIFHIFPPPKSIYMVYIPTSKQSKNN